MLKLMIWMVVAVVSGDSKWFAYANDKHLANGKIFYPKEGDWNDSTIEICSIKWKIGFFLGVSARLISKSD